MTSPYTAENMLIFWLYIIYVFPPTQFRTKKNWDKYISMKISTSTHPLLLQNPSVMIFKKSHEEFTD